MRSSDPQEASIVSLRGFGCVGGVVWVLSALPPLSHVLHIDPAVTVMSSQVLNVNTELRVSADEPVNWGMPSTGSVLSAAGFCPATSCPTTLLQSRHAWLSAG